MVWVLSNALAFKASAEYLKGMASRSLTKKADATGSSGGEGADAHELTTGWSPVRIETRTAQRDRVLPDSFFQKALAGVADHQKLNKLRRRRGLGRTSTNLAACKQT